MIKGGFKFVNERGMPLDIFLELLHRRNSVIDWEDFIRSALATGWYVPTILNKVEEAASDILGKSQADELILRIKLLSTKILNEDRSRQTT